MERTVKLLNEYQTEIKNRRKKKTKERVAYLLNLQM